MDIVQYEELKQKIAKFEELSKTKENLEYEIKCLEEDSNAYIYANTSHDRLYFCESTSKKIRDSILGILKNDLENISSEIDDI